MHLPDLLKKGRLQPAWSYTTGGILWQIQTGSKRFLVGEDRGIEKKATSFFCVERRTGKILWRNLTPGDRWWVGIEAVTDEVVVFHSFASPDMPGHRSITVAELESGRVLWRNPDLTFVGLGQGLITARAESHGRRHVVRVAPLTGEILNELDAEEVDRRPPPREETPAGDGVLLPFPVRDVADEDPAIVLCLDRHMTAGLQTAQVLDVSGLVIVQVSEPGVRRREEPPELRTVLKIVERADGHLLYSDVLEERASVASPQFFVQDGQLYYVRERTTLSAVFLSDGSFRGKALHKDPA